MLSSLNAVISTNERNWILTGHEIFKLCYNQLYQLKTTMVPLGSIKYSIILSLSLPLVVVAGKLICRWRILRHSVSDMVMMSSWSDTTTVHSVSFFEFSFRFCNLSKFEHFLMKKKTCTKLWKNIKIHH